MKNPAGLTCNCGVISGGSVPNTVAGYCEFVANFRFKDKAQKEEVDAFAEKLAKTEHVKGCTCSVELVSFRPAMERTEKNMNLYYKLCEISEENGLPHIEAGSRTGGSDAAYITELGIPCIDALGTIGGLIHSENEFSYMSSLSDRAKIISSLIYCI